ncbi:MAG TPA: VWA domain-containing protein [Pyrinomonadaceae bacterium]|jgi:VWFA-related protein
MKNSAILLAILIGCLILHAPAQSGRKSKTTPTPVPVPQTQTPDDYSESKPDNSRIIAPNSTKDKKSKKEATSAETQPDAQTAETVNDEDAIKVETNLITIPVSVYEKSGVYVGDLGKSDFKIFEDGKEQEIAYFGTAEQPFSVILLIDTSPSTSFKIEEIQAAAIAFVDQLKIEDKVMVISFDSSVHVQTDFTNERQKIYKAIRRTSFGGGTTLYDAVETSLHRKLSKIDGRKAIVLFTDGVDTASRGASFNSTLEQAEEADALIFPIYYNTFLENRGIGGGGGAMSTPPTIGFPQGRGAPTSRDYANGRGYLEGLAQATGGKMFRAESTVGGLNAAFEGIAKELRSQYSIGYYPTEAGEKGQRKRIKVRVSRANVAVRARDSYIVGAADPTSKKRS